MRHKIKTDLRYPQLWKNCFFAAAPLLGPTGSTLQDQSGYSHNGTMAATMDASTGWEPSGGKYAAKFDGTDDYFDSVGSVSDFSFIQNTLLFTVSWWQKMSSLTVRMGPLGNCISGSDKGILILNEYGAGVGTNCLRVAVYKGTGGGVNGVITKRTADNTLTTGWQHLAVSGTGTDLVIYINGISVSLTTEFAFLSLSSGDSTRVLNIGRNNHSSNLLTMNGFIDDIRIYNTAIPVGSVKALALRRGIAYETAQRRSYKATAAPAATANNLMLLGVG
jgi:hypothetical protein